MSRSSTNGIKGTAANSGSTQASPEPPNSLKLSSSEIRTLLEEMHAIAAPQMGKLSLMLSSGKGLSMTGLESMSKDFAIASARAQALASRLRTRP